MASTTAPSDTLPSLSIDDSTHAAPTRTSVPAPRPPKVDKKGKEKGTSNANANQGPGEKKKPGPKPNPSSSTKLRGMDRDSPEVRISKTLSWLLRHGAQGEGLPMRPDGYVKVSDLLSHPKLKAQGLDLEAIKGIVKADSKQRYDLVLENAQGVKLESFTAPVVTTPTSGAALDTPAAAIPAADDGIWWIKARQGHSIKTVKLELKPITSAADIPTGIAVHGTNQGAWEIIAKQGLSKMKRNHIHLAQGVAGEGVISGMRSSSKVLIYINVQKALDAGIKFWLSDNGVVLTEGDDKGLLARRFFEKVVDSRGGEIEGWEEEEQNEYTSTMI